MAQASAARVRRIAHLDMDAFYASVELLRRPELAGQPLVIGGRRAGSSDAPGRLRDYAGRGVVTTATYAARALGVHSGMGLMKAARLAPQALLLPADFDAYRSASARFKAAVRAIAPQVEDRGIDEIYIDLTDRAEATAPLAARLKAAVRAVTGLSCSIGVAPNKLLAKIASELDKPDGLTILVADDLPTRIWPLPVGRINGVGPRAQARLAALGVATIGELAAQRRERLLAEFGRSYGEWLAAAAQGHDERPVVTEREPRSVSRETTFERDLHARADRTQLSAILLDLCARLAADLARHELRARTIGVKLRFEDFRTVTRAHTLAQATAEAGTIRAAARECLRRVAFERRLRLLGVRASALVGAHEAAIASVARPVTRALFE